MTTLRGGWVGQSVQERWVVGGWVGGSGRGGSDVAHLGGNLGDNFGDISVRSDDSVRISGRY